MKEGDAPVESGHAQTIVAGLLDAWRVYGRWSQNFMVHDEGIEAFLSVKIAEALHNTFADACRVRLEVPVKTLRDLSESKVKGRYPDVMRRMGRVDIGFFDEKGALSGLIEVKRNFSASGQGADFTRLASMLSSFGPRNGGTLRWTALAALHTVWSSNKKTTNQRVESVRSKLSSDKFVIETCFVEELLTKPWHTETDSLLGAAGICLLIKDVD